MTTMIDDYVMLLEVMVMIDHDDHDKIRYNDDDYDHNCVDGDNNTYGGCELGS